MVNLPPVSRRRLSNIGLSNLSVRGPGGHHSDDESEPYVPDSKEEEETIRLLKRGPPKAPKQTTRKLDRRPLGHKREPSGLVSKLMAERAAKRKTAPPATGVLGFSPAGSGNSSPMHSPPHRPSRDSKPMHKLTLS